MALLFTRIFNMSVSAGYIVLVVLLLRLALKKAPKWVTLLLWGIVGIRLVCPVTFESVWSLIPSVGQIPPIAAGDQYAPFAPYYSEISAVNTMIIQRNPDFFVRPLGDRLEQMQRLMPIAAAVWLTGVAALAAYSIFSCRKLRSGLSTAVRCQQNVYQSENVRAAFVFGLLKPKIYLPFDMDAENMTHVIAHEKAHIRRLDHLWKPLGFAALAVHWFNPLIWLGYVLFCRDIEFACDEKVIKYLERDAVADYSQALLSCSGDRFAISACPLAFGEIGVKKRIKSVLNYRKPAFWIVAVALLVCVAASVCFFTEPISAYNMGIRRVSVKQLSSEEFELRIRHAYCYSGYSVQYLSAGDPDYTPNGAIPYDGHLGKSRVLVSFSDDEPTLSLVRQLDYGEVVELKGAPVKILAHMTQLGADHGFNIYFGIDEDIQIEEVGGAKLDKNGGTVTIPIRIKRS